MKLTMYTLIFHVCIFWYIIITVSLSRVFVVGSHRQNLPQIFFFTLKNILVRQKR